MESVTIISPADPGRGPSDPATPADLVTVADLLAKITDIRVMLARIEGKLDACTRRGPR